MLDNRVHRLKMFFRRFCFFSSFKYFAIFPLQSPLSSEAQIGIMIYCQQYLILLEISFIHLFAHKKQNMFIRSQQIIKKILSLFLYIYIYSLLFFFFWFKHFCHHKKFEIYCKGLSWFMNTKFTLVLFYRMVSLTSKENWTVQQRFSHLSVNIPANSFKDSQTSVEVKSHQ